MLQPILNINFFVSVLFFKSNLMGTALAIGIVMCHYVNNDDEGASDDILRSKIYHKSDGHNHKDCAFSNHTVTHDWR